MKQHKPWFDEECLGTLDQRKQAKMHCIHDSSQNNVDNMNNVRREASRYLRNKKKAYLKAKIEELETNSKTENIRDFIRASMTSRKVNSLELIVKDEKGDFIADSHSILAMWMNHFLQLLNVHGVNDVR
jgi:hypothetical protein